MAARGGHGGKKGTLFGRVSPQSKLTPKEFKETGKCLYLYLYLYLDFA